MRRYVATFSEKRESLACHKGGFETTLLKIMVLLNVSRNNLPYQVDYTTVKERNKVKNKTTCITLQKKKKKNLTYMLSIRYTASLRHKREKSNNYQWTINQH